MTDASGWTYRESPFHAGEQAVQRRLGVRENAERLGRRVIRDYLPEQHRQFYRELPFLLVGTLDAEGWPWASIVAGPAGFISSPDPRSLHLASAPLFGSPLAEHLAVDAPVGILGIMPEVRRRNRLTGRIASHGDDGLHIAVDQTFGNCPQYIQARTVETLSSPAPAKERPLEEGQTLDAEARTLIESADTFFIGSAYGDPRKGPAHGADVSHRGGPPGFVRVEDGAILFPDFSGNNHFNTLGNIVESGRAGLMFLDFSGGDLLYLTGTAEIIWDGDEVDAYTGAQRLVRITPVRWRRVRDSLPMRFTFDSLAPGMDSIGGWHEVDALRSERTAAGWSEAEIRRVFDESDEIRSFYIVPLGGKVAAHEPGQFLPVRLPIDGGLERTYTLSAAAGEGAYRLSVKREHAGRASRFLHDDIRVGDRIEIRAPTGQFVLDRSSDRPVVLLSAGVGITPLLAMGQELALDTSGSGRDVYFIHGARDGASHAFADEVRELARRNPRFHVHTAYSRPRHEDRIGETFDSVGRVDVNLLKTILPFDDYDFYICGPGDFMQSVYTGLRNLAIDDARIRFESFGPSAVKRSGTPLSVPQPEPVVPVAFARSGIVAEWTPGAGSLLELAEAHGVEAPYACRAGACGACETPLIEGAVAYSDTAVDAGAKDRVRICRATPVPGRGGTESGLVLDL